MISLCNYCDRHTPADGSKWILNDLNKVEYQETSGKAMTGGNGPIWPTSASNRACNVASGTKPTCRGGLTMSVYRRIDRKWLAHGQNVANDPVRKSAVTQPLRVAPRATSAATVRVSTGNIFRARFLVTLREQCGPPARTNLRRNSVRASMTNQGRHIAGCH